MTDTIDRLIALGEAGTARTLEAALGENPLPSDGLLNFAANALAHQVARLTTDPADKAARAAVEGIVALMDGYGRATRAADRRGAALTTAMDLYQPHEVVEQFGLPGADAKALWDTYREASAEQGTEVAPFPDRLLA